MLYPVTNTSLRNLPVAVEKKNERGDWRLVETICVKPGETVDIRIEADKYRAIIGEEP